MIKPEELSSVTVLGHFISPRRFSRDQHFFFYPGGKDRTRFLTKTAAAFPKTIMKNKISSKILSTCVFAAALGYAVSQEKKGPSPIHSQGNKHVLLYISLLYHSQKM